MTEVIKSMPSPILAKASAKRGVAKVCLVQTTVGDYRQAVLEYVAANTPGGFHVYAGDIYFDGTTKTRVHLGDDLTQIKNHFLLGKKFLWQTGMWRDLLRADSAILEFNPRILSVWVLAAARRALRKRTVFWGHAWPRRGREAKSLPIRLMMSKLANCVLVYTETQASDLRSIIPGTPILAAPNALYSARSMGPAQPTTTPSNFIYVGRLVPEKKPELLVKGFAKAIDRLPADSRLVFVGEGPSMDILKKEAADAEIADRVDFEGHIADQSKLRDLYADAIASVSPGYVGLSVTQSLSFGVPMIVARNEPHAPEIEAVRDGENAMLFRENDPADLADKLVTFANERESWFKRRSQISSDCAERYSVELMGSRMLLAALAKPATTHQQAA